MQLVAGLQMESALFFFFFLSEGESSQSAVALVLTINTHSPLNKLSQTMQLPAESRDEDVGSRSSLAVLTSYQ